MTAASLLYNVPLLATPFDSTTTNSTSPSPSQMANGFIASVDVVASATQNYLHNSTTAYIWLMQQLGLMMPFNPVAGASVVATKAGGIVSLRNSSTNATEFYVAKVDMAVGYTDPSLDPTYWQLINFNELAKYSSIPVILASAATVNIGAALSGNVTISGSTTITAFDNVPAGIIRWVTYSGAVPITYNITSMQLIGGTSRTNAIGDVSIFESLGSGNWKEYFYSGINPAFDARYAAIAGLGTQLFSAANGTSGNQVINFSQALGLGQTWQDFTASRALGITYTNSTTKPIYVTVTTTGSGIGAGAQITVGGVIVDRLFSTAVTSSNNWSVSALIPPGSTYSATNNGSSTTLLSWIELR